MILSTFLSIQVSFVDAPLSVHQQVSVSYQTLLLRLNLSMDRNANVARSLNKLITNSTFTSMGFLNK